MRFSHIAVLAGLVAGASYAPLHADAPTAPAAVDKQAIRSQLHDLETQIQGVRAEIRQFNAQKTSLWDQVSSLRTQKHLADLQRRLDDLTVKLQAAQSQSQTAKAADLATRQGTVQKELALQQDINGLLVKLEAAHAAADTPTAKALNDQIAADRNNVKALYPPKPTTSVPVAAPAVATPKPEDPQIQALLDQIHALEDKIKQDQSKIAALKQQADVLRAQLKGR